MSPRIAAVDVGQSGSRLRLPDGTTLNDGPAYSPSRGLLETVSETLRLKNDWKSEIVALSLTALRGVVPEPTEFGLLCHNIAGANAVVVMDDGMAAHAGAFGDGDGVVLCVGTGVSVVARRGQRAAHRDGDGPIVGDDGGGYWLGREAIRSALRAAEDRGPATSLLSALQAKHGELRTALRSHSDETAMLWSIDAVPTLFSSAKNDDPVALDIARRGAALLSASAAAAWRELGSSESPALSGVGGVMSDQFYCDLILNDFRRTYPESSWHPAQGNNLDGAVDLASSSPSDIAPLLKWWRA